MEALLNRFGFAEPFFKFFKVERNFNRDEWVEILELELIAPFRNPRFSLQSSLSEGLLIGLMYSLLFFTVGLFSYQEYSMLFLLGVIGFTHGFVYSLMLDKWSMSNLYSAGIGTLLTVLLLIICHIMSTSAGWGGIF